MTCACSRISSSGSMVSCMTPTLNGGAGVMPVLLRGAGERAAEVLAALERAAERAVRAVLGEHHRDVRGGYPFGLALLEDVEHGDVVRAVLRRAHRHQQGVVLRL